MRHVIVAWCRSWRRLDVTLVLLAAAVMVLGMVLPVEGGVWVLLALVPGFALLWRTPLVRRPVELGEPEATRPPTLCGSVTVSGTSACAATGSSRH